MTQPCRSRSISPKEAAACGGPLDELLDPAVFKALGDPTRAKLLSCLVKCGRPCTVTEVAACCAVDFSVVSRHLALLERAGFVRSLKTGRTVWYEHYELRVAKVERAYGKAVAGGDAGPAGEAR